MAITALAGPTQAGVVSPPPAAPTFTALLGPMPSGLDAEDGGVYRVAATVKIKGTPNTPVARRVVLHDQLSGRVVRSTWSDAATGAYAFERIRRGPFYVAAFDHTGDKRAEIVDNLTLENGGVELMP